jgi:predicted nucleic acid-binding Zn ribbon protein
VFALAGSGFFLRQHCENLHMPTYVYETCPSKPGAKPIRFEYEQRMSEAPLSKHPETGEPVRRVISGGIGFVCGNDGSSSPAPASSSSCTAPGCSHAHH